jgi:hypothetical protein
VARSAALPVARLSADWPAVAEAPPSGLWWEQAPARLLPAMADAAMAVIIGIAAIATFTATAADGTAYRTAIAERSTYSTR